MDDQAHTAHGPIERDIDALTRAFHDLVAAIEAVDDPDDAFTLATLLGNALRAATGANGLLRARLAARVWSKHELDLTKLGQRLGGIGKSRAGQLLQSARAQEDRRQVEAWHEQEQGEQS